MNATYFCNTFIQFSGLGYRVYYLKKFKNLKISEILRYSIDTIVCELFIFSFIGLISILFIDLYSEEIKISYIIYLFFFVFFFSSLIYLNFLFSMVLFIRNFFNKFNFYFLINYFNFFLIKKKIIFPSTKNNFLFL